MLVVDNIEYDRLLIFRIHPPLRVNNLARYLFAKSKKESTKTYYQVLELKTDASQK